MIREFFKRLLCKHSYVVEKWHFTHGAMGNEPRYIEGFERCPDCGKERYFTVERGSKYEDYIINHMQDRQW